MSLTIIDGTYARNKCKSRDTVNKLVSKLYGGYSFIVPSGIYAITLAVELFMENNKWQNFGVVMGSELYCETPRIFTNLADRYGLKANIEKVYAGNFKDIQKEVDKLASSMNIILFLESCSNPSGVVPDYDAIKKLKARYGQKLTVIIDNTWLTGTSFNPFKYDADYAVESGSKYLSHGKRICGFITCKDKYRQKQISDYIRIYGVHVSPDTTNILQETIYTLPLRQEKLSKITNDTASYLESLKSKIKVCQVMHPSLASHPSYSQARKFFSYQPGVIWIKIEIGKADAIELFKKSEIPYETSFGKETTVIDPWPKADGKYTWFRLAIGSSDTYFDLTKKLNKLLDT